MKDDYGRFITAGILILLGVIFLAGQVFDLSVLSTFWPAFVLLPGIVFLALALRPDPRFSGFIFPGLMVTGTGLVLFYQSFSGNWESWAYIWAIYPLLAGVAMMFTGQRNNQPAVVKTGRSVMIVSLLGLIAFGVFFELFIFRGVGTDVAQYLVPIMLILAGAWMLFGSRRGTTEKEKTG